MANSQIASMFEVYRLNQDGLDRADMVAEQFSSLFWVIRKECDHALAGHEWEIVKLKLQEACFFAKRAVALDPRNQLPKKEQP